MPPQFYNLRDQAIYSAGDFFIPQERYRAAPYNVNNPAPDDPAAAGIPAIYQSQGGGGGGGYTGGISDLTGDFFKTTSDRQNRLTELNRPLQAAQFPSFPGPRTPGGFDAQEMYNKASADLNDPFNRLATTQTFSGQMRPAKEVMDYADDIIDDYRMQYATGQLGPSFIEAEKPTLSRRINDAIYSLPFLSKPQSADQVIAEGYTGQSNMPGIMSMVLSKMDQYGSLPRGDQAFIARNMGYTGPTVFGENASGLGKDPFGLNVRSGFGNYAERVGVEAEKLGESLSGRLTDKYQDQFGITDDEELSYNPATGQYIGTNLAAVAKANQMTKMMRAKHNFYKKQTIQRDADRAAAAAAAAKREKDFAALGRSDPNDPSRQGASGRRPGSGGTVDRVTSGPGRNVDDTGQAYDSGGREGFGYGLADGGIVDMLEIYD